jgi:hypothetical protein
VVAEQRRPGVVIEPYTFIRTVTLTLAAFWTLRGLWRMARFLRRWEARLVRFGARPAQLRLGATIFLLRATILDPINLALMLVLVRIWTLDPT